MNFAVFASGRGGNLLAIINAVKTQAIKADLKLVISDKKEALALERAQNAGIEAIYINPKDFKDRESFDKEALKRLTEFKIDFIVFAGYMRLVSPCFNKQYPLKILNIHPSLLPSFKGTHAIKDAFEQGVKVTGPTIHFVVEDMDAGPIIFQEPVRIEAGDTIETLEEKIHQAEHRIYPYVIDLFAQGKLKVEGRRVIISS